MAREREVAAVAAALAASGTTTLVTGPTGIGRSWLLDAAATAASDEGVRVLRASGSVDESTLPYAALHQLLHGAIEDVAGELPDHQRRALLGALGYDTTLSDPLTTAMATLSVLCHRAATGQLAVVVDDVHLVDPESAQVIAFLARRVAGHPVSVLVASSADVLLPGFDRATLSLELQPLSAEAAATVLDGLPVVPVGRTRMEIVRLAGGNPLVLRELAAAHAGQPYSDRAVLTAPLRPTPTLCTAFPVDLAQLPPSTRAAVVDLAVADDDDRAGAALWDGDPDSEVWRAATAVGITTDCDGRIALRLPVFRSLIAWCAGADERRAAHRRWEVRLSGRPDRALWHRACATNGSDEHTAAELARMAQEWHDAASPAAAAAAFELAAELTADPARRTQRSLGAIRSAGAAGEASTVRRLLHELDTGPGRGSATDTVGRRMIGWLDAAEGRLDAALDGLLRVVADPASPAPVRWASLAPAATVAYQVGRPTTLDRVAAALTVPSEAPTDAASYHELDRAISELWSAVGTGWWTGPRARTRLRALDRLAPNYVHTEIAAAAWVLDDPVLTATRCETMLAHSEVTDAQFLLIGGWALFELGRWDEAAARLAQATVLARTWGQRTVEACVLTGVAALAAARGDRVRAEISADHAGRLLDPAASRAVDVRAAHSRGLAALAHGDHPAAWAHLVHAAGPEARRHFHASQYLVADLAEAAVRCGKGDHARARLTLDDPHDDTATPRARQLRHHAWAVLDADAGRREDAERHFRSALADETGDTWPFERARVRLAWGRWLRRERRVTESREPLERAAAEFARLGAVPWTAAARQELRASGSARTAADSRGVRALTATERQIVHLAALGLTNREIADRLFLSSRTVGSHLYRIFPKLGVTTRGQLRDVPLHEN